MKKIFFVAFCFIMIGCGSVMDGLIDSTHEEVDKVGEKEVYLLTYSNEDGLYYHTTENGTFKFSGRNYIKYNNGNVKEKSQFKKGEKHGNWLWFNKQGAKVKKEVWDEGTLISDE